MVEIIKALAVAVMFISLIVGAGYWIRIIFKKKYPNFKYWFKYKIFKKKYDEGDVKRLIQYLDANMKPVNVEKMILLSPKNKRTPKQVKEVIYIYSELQKIERGKKI